MSERILETYLESLDYNRLFFTQEDIDQIIKKYGSGLGDDIMLSNLTFAKDIRSSFKQRMDARISKVNVLLKEQYTFTLTGQSLRIVARSDGRLVRQNLIKSGAIGLRRTAIVSHRMKWIARTTRMYFEFFSKRLCRHSISIRNTLDLLP
jgi:hypothetical protein